MNYTIQDLENDISDVITELAQMRKAKGHDYSGASSDNLSNYRDFGWKYVIGRLGEKYHRLVNIIKLDKIEVLDETVEDTLKDMINLSLYSLIMRRQEDAVQAKKPD